MFSIDWVLILNKKQSHKNSLSTTSCDNIDVWLWQYFCWRKVIVLLVWQPCQTLQSSLDDKIFQSVEGQKVIEYPQRFVRKRHICAKSLTYQSLQIPWYCIFSASRWKGKSATGHGQKSTVPFKKRVRVKHKSFTVSFRGIETPCPVETMANLMTPS